MVLMIFRDAPLIGYLTFLTLHFGINFSIYVHIAQQEVSGVRLMAAAVPTGTPMRFRELGCGCSH